jgi:hypothetical protein
MRADKHTMIDRIQREEREEGDLCVQVSRNGRARKGAPGSKESSLQWGEGGLKE